MRFKDYFDDGNTIITSALISEFEDFLTERGASVINDYFYIEQGELFMYKDDPEEVEKMAEYILNKNYEEYLEIYKSLTNEILSNPEYTTKIEKTPSNITELSTPSGMTETNTPSNITETETPGSTTETHTPSNITETESPSGSTETETPGQKTITHTPAETTETNTPAEKTESKTTKQAGSKTITNSTKPFDSAVFVETEKSVESDSPYDEERVTSYEGSDVKKYEVDANEVTTETQLQSTRQTTYTQGSKGTTFTQESRQITHTQGSKSTQYTQGTKQQTYTQGSKSTTLTKETTVETKISELINNYEQLRELYKVNLWDRIIKDLITVLAIRRYSDFILL